MTTSTHLRQLSTLQPGDSHSESLIEAAIQGHADTREAMRWLVRQLVPATQAEVTDEQIKEAFLANGFTIKDGHSDLKPYVYAAARAILALRPERVPMTPRETELIDGMIAVQLDHAQRCDAISNRAMAEKQKGWDMERVELLRRIRSFGITAQAKKEGA